MRLDSRWLLPGLAVVLVIAVLLSLTIGRYPVSLSEVARILTTTSPFSARQPYTNEPWVVIEMVRLPRVLAVTLCGAGLALAGAAAQGIFRNPLVSPEIMGVSSGASLAGALGIVLSWSTLGIVGAAFCGGVVALACAWALARMGRQVTILSLILAGVIVGSAFSSLLGLLKYVADAQAKLPSIVYWLLGSFTGVTYEKLAVVAAATLIGGVGLLALSWRINVLSLGDTDASALGVNVNRLRWSVIACISLLVAAQVSISGVVGFVGLIVPHLARMLVGAEHSRLMPAAALLGGLFLLGVDDVARTIVTTEVPIGVLTSVIGTPVFAFLFRRQQRQGWLHV